jgi:hypothetical protein
MVVFFYLSGNAEVAAESGLFIILCTSITQVLSSNMRSLAIANKSIKINLDNYFIFRFLFSIFYLLILFFFILPYFKLQYPTFVFLLSSTILFQWVFETKLVKFELLGNHIKLLILLIFYSILGLIGIFLAIKNNIFALNCLLILFCLYVLGFSLKKSFFLLKKINLLNSLFLFKKYTQNYVFSPILSSFSLVLSGLFWRFSIYYLFEKSVAGLLFAGLTLGSFSGTLFNLILGPAYLKANIKIGKKIKFFIFFIFFIFLFLNINIYFNLSYNYDALKDYIFNVDKLFYIVAMHSILGSFFMTYSMYQRHKMIFKSDSTKNIFIRDFIYNLILCVLFPLLYWLYNLEGITSIFLVSSVISLIFYKFLPINFFKNYNVSYSKKQ